MPNAATPDSPTLAPVPLEGVDPIECCAACKFWHQGALQKTPQGVAAPCRRYPITAVIVTSIQPGPRGPTPVQGGGTIPTLTPGTEWCGEFKLRIP